MRRPADDRTRRAWEDRMRRATEDRRRTVTPGAARVIVDRVQPGDDDATIGAIVDEVLELDEVGR